MKAETGAALKVVAVGCFIVFFVFVGMSVPFYMRQREVLKNWRITDAKVLAADMVPVAGQRGAKYMARFLVEYRAGQAIMSSTVNPGYGTMFQSQSRNWIERFPAGSTVKIAYDPLDATRVRLDPGYNANFFAVPLFITGAGLVFALIGATFYLVARRGNTKRGRVQPGS